MRIDLELENKVAVVTGAGGGIGREMALALAAEGASIVVNDIGVSLTGDGGSKSPAEETCGLITQKGGQAITSNESVSTWESAQLIIKKAIDTYGKIDIVINNAGCYKLFFIKWNSVTWTAAFKFIKCDRSLEDAHSAEADTIVNKTQVHMFT